jgi:hypothetical protein
LATKSPQSQPLVVNDDATRLRDRTPEYPATFFLRLAAGFR